MIRALRIKRGAALAARRVGGRRLCHIKRRRPQGWLRGFRIWLCTVVKPKRTSHQRLTKGPKGKEAWRKRRSCKGRGRWRSAATASPTKTTNSGTLKGDEADEDEVDGPEDEDDRGDEDVGDVAGRRQEAAKRDRENGNDGDQEDEPRPRTAQRNTREAETQDADDADDVGPGMKKKKERGE